MKKIIVGNFNMKRAMLCFIFTFHFSLFTYCQYTILNSFNDTSGKYPLGNLTLVGHKFYGMTSEGGAYDSGCIFSIDTNGSNFRNLHDFNGTAGCYPYGSLLNGGNKLYGMTFEGGLGGGIIFSIDTDGTGFTDLNDFSGIGDGFGPMGSLIISGNVLFGTTTYSATNVYGTVFSIHTDGSNLKVLHTFQGYPFDFSNESGHDVTLVGRTLYGMARNGGPLGYGGIFSIDTSGYGYRMLFQFNDTNGGYPWGSLTLSGKILYGMTAGGGIHNAGVVFKIDTDGSNEKVLLNFKGDSNGEAPYGNVTLSGKRLFGMTKIGGGYEVGVIFSVDTNGTRYKRMFIFNDTNGMQPWGSLTMIGPNLYGMTAGGGEYFWDNSNQGYGVIFRADTSLNDTSHITTSSGQWLVVNGQWEVYPNPSIGIFTIALRHATPINSASASQTMIEVFNVLGEKVYSAPFHLPSSGGSVSFSCLINLSSAPNGVYFYKIIDENGENIGIGKLVIEH